MMYQVFLFVTFLVYCLSNPITDKESNLDNDIIHEKSNQTSYVDDLGTGYNYFRRQNIDSRPINQPLATMTDEDLLGYSQSSAFKKSPPAYLMDRDASDNDDYENHKAFLFPNFAGQEQEHQQRKFHPNDRSSFRPSTGYNARRQNYLNRKLYAQQQQQQQQQQDYRSMNPYQPSHMQQYPQQYPQNNFNFQPSYGNQQQQPQQALWNPSFDAQNQQFMQSRFPWSRN